MKPFYITTAIVYANADPHIGFALELIYADVLARYYRMSGRDVRYLTGTDEHGSKISRKAEEAGKEPKIFVDEIAARVRELADELNIGNDDFIQTTEERHHKSVEAFWKRVDKAGYIYKKAYKGLYCVGCESFKTEKDLVVDVCPDHKTPCEEVEEENYFFKLSAFQEKLEKLYEERPDFVVPETKFNEMKQLLKSGLEDISISRSTKMLKWGIPVPGDDGQVIYVWFDALVNYISAIGYGEDDKMMRKYWPADIHIIGKEINRFHSVLWPAMLMAAGVKVPQQIGVHGWITVDGEKMSKTRGNVLDPFDLIDRYGTEPLRYFMMREIPFHSDGDFSFKRFEERFNNDLANELGNLLNRAVAMTDRYLGGVVPAVVDYNVKSHWTQYRKSMEDLRFHDGLEAAWKIVRDMNKFIDDKKPWELGKLDDKTEVSVVLYTLLEALRHVAWMIMPVTPETSYKIFEAIGTSVVEQAQMPMKEAAIWGGLQPGAKVILGEQLFPRIETKKE
ncbi:MAG TPA: methionine--tRNA ligase [Patescibacteria group bacterium]|nr:methionine--tRNA ligase [Patescibacteria group bacterium]